MKCLMKVGSCFYTTPYTLEIPAIFKQLVPAPEINSLNPLTQEGVDLGKKLYYIYYLERYLYPEKLS